MKMTHLILHSETNLTAGHFQSFVKLLIFTETGLKLHAEWIKRFLIKYEVKFVFHLHSLIPSQETTKGRSHPATQSHER